MNLKKQLKLFLEIKRLSASELSRISGVPKQSLSDWLGGSTPRDIRKVKKVADVFSVTLDHLLFGDGIEEKFERVPISTEASERIATDDWKSGVFEVKFRRIKK